MGEPPGIIAGFEFDDANVAHMALHGLEPNMVWDVWADEPILVPRTGRSGTHLMIGQESSGRVWSIAVLLVDDELDIWRPITGWPSTRKEERTWRGRS
ncbi:MAG: hypothetical protein EPO22_11120 [Dehalococcoidia bacterium]|nr:MAG: hypothetical protein EPO22_11120 [Dehalococcoidia bacterium]